MANMCNTDEKAFQKKTYIQWCPYLVGSNLEDEPLPIECLFQNECLLCFFKKYMHCISPLATVISSSLYGCFVPSVSFKPVLATV